MKKRWICLFAALTFAISVCAVRPVVSGAAPSDPVDLKRTCSLEVSPVDSNDPEKADYLADMQKAQITLDLYKVAGTEKVAGYDTYRFTPEASFSGLTTSEGVGISEYADLQKLTAADWEELAQEAAKTALREGGPAAVKSQDVIHASAAELSELDSGLYLLVARDTNWDRAEYVKTVNQGLTTGEGDLEITQSLDLLVTVANSPRYEYQFMPQLIALPAKQAVDEVISTSGRVPWQYMQSVVLKSGRENRYTSLEIRKTLRSYEEAEGTIEPATFVFRVVGTMEGESEPVYDAVDSITFTGPGTGSTTLDHIPATATVTVTEIYSGISYTQVVPPNNGSVVLDQISAEPGPDGNYVSFENEYNNRRTHGHGIKNQFVYNAETGGWDWSRDPAQQTGGQEGE